METQTLQSTDSKLREFFVEQLKDIYWAEQKLVKTLPKLEDAATTPQLKEAFVNHLHQTEEHVSRLEQIFGMVNEGEHIIDETEEGTSQRDVGLIFAGQKAEHYEIATYGGLISLAKTLGLDGAVNMLHLTLAEEKAADQLLTQIAENNVNYLASLEAVE